MCHGKRSGEAGILHADFDCDCFLLCEVEVESLSNNIAEQVAKQVVEYDDEHNEKACLQDLLRTYCYDAADYKNYRCNGNKREDFDDLLHEVSKEVADEKAGDDRYEDDLNY